MNSEMHLDAMIEHNWKSTWTWLIWWGLIGRCDEFIVS